MLAVPFVTFAVEVVPSRVNVTVPPLTGVELLVTVALKAIDWALGLKVVDTGLAVVSWLSRFPPCPD